MPIFESLFASAASVRVPEHTSAMLYFLVNFHLSILPPLNEMRSQVKPKGAGSFPSIY